MIDPPQEEKPTGSPRCLSFRAGRRAIRTVVVSAKLVREVGKPTGRFQRSKVNNARLGDIGVKSKRKRLGENLGFRNAE